MKSSSLSPHPAVKTGKKGRKSKPHRGQASRREYCVLVIGEEPDYWVKIKQARHLLHARLAVIHSKKPFVLKAGPVIERIYFSNFVCRKLREHRDELIHQVSKAKTGKPRRAYNEVFKQGRYIRLPHGFGRE